MLYPLSPEMLLDVHNQRLEELRAQAHRDALARALPSRTRLALRQTRARIAAWRHATA
jgi:hypothetical protein